MRCLLPVCGIFQLVGCVAPQGPSPDASVVPMTEQTYRQAANYCHSKEVIRMRPGVPNTFYLGGLAPADPRKAAHIECVRRYLGIPKKDVIILLS